MAEQLLDFDVRRHTDAQFLATRKKGQELRGLLEDQISRMPVDEVVIDFSGIEAMTISFADEFVGRFYAAPASDTDAAPIVLLSGLNEENLTTVSICLERRDLAAAALIDQQLVLVGAPDYLTETYEQAVSLGTFSAVDLAGRLGLTAQNMNNRLKRLVAAAAIRRRRGASSRGGKEFTYTAPSPCPLPG
jgi:hypothetical protein